jgi:TPP-dependent pyruvate/acetoin dehydrogenase alpha subunit
MKNCHGRVDRRTLLKTMSAAGATATVISACGEQSASARGITGAKFDKTVRLATAGPGGSKQWKPGYALEFLPPEDMPTRGEDSAVLAAEPKEKLLDLYRLMSTSRKWETTMKDLFLAGKDGLYGAFHTYVGEEAVAVGVIGALNEDDYIASTHRGHGHLIAKGGDLNRMSAEIFFRESGYNKGYGGSMHITDMSKGIMGMNGIVGASFYMAAGAALRGMIRGTKQVAVAFFGDGGAASPYYFSAVRSCKNLDIPVIFVNENNFQYMSIPVADTAPTKYISDYTKGLDLPHHLVDGNNVAAVYNATKQAVEWAHAGKGPSVIEALTYRWYDHSGFAGARVGQEGAVGLPYRTDDEVRGWMTRDPIPRYKRWLVSKGLAKEDELARVEQEAQAAVDASVEFARNGADPDPAAGVLNTHADGAVLASQFYNRKNAVVT